METIKESRNWVPAMAIHPTEYIKDEMKARGIKSAALAKMLGMQPSNFSRMLSKKESITPTMAIKLENALGVSAETWTNLQIAYDKDVQAVSERNAQEQDAMSVERTLAGVLDLNVLYSKELTSAYTYTYDKIQALYKAFGVENADGLIGISAAAGCFKKSEAVSTEERELRTWVLLAHKRCCETEVDTAYSRDALLGAAKHIAAMTNNGTITEHHIKAELNKAGVGYGVEAKLPKAPVDAYSAFVGGRPYIITSHRYNNMDMLVFDVLHEICHILNHLEAMASNISCRENNNSDPREQEANAFAEDMLIARDVWNSIMKTPSKSLSPYSVIGTVISEAGKHGISPSIAAWRYKHETGIYNFGKYNSLKIR